MGDLFTPLNMLLMGLIVMMSIFGVMVVWGPNARKR